MKYIILSILFFFGAVELIHSQTSDTCDYSILMQEGDSLVHRKEIQAALNKYYAAQTCNPSKSDEIENRLTQVLKDVKSELDSISLLKLRNEESKYVNYNFLLANKLANKNPSVSLRILDYINTSFEGRYSREFQSAFDQIYSDLTNGYYRSVIDGHQEAVVALAFSPNNNRQLISGSRDGSAKLWNIEESQENLMANYSFAGEYVNELAFWQDNSVVIAAGKNLFLQQKEHFYFPSIRNIIGTHEDDIHALDASSELDLIVSGGTDNKAIVWSGGAIQSTLPHPDAIDALSINARDRTVATGCWDGNIRIWNVDGDTIPIKEWVAHRSHIYGLKYSEDGRYLISGSRDNTATLWTSEGDSIAAFKGHTGSIYSVDISSDGKLILTGSRDGTARLWANDGTCVRIFRGHSDVIYSVAFSSDEQFIATGSKDNTARIWETNPVDQGSVEPHSDAVYTAQFSPDGKYVLTGGRDFTTIKWNWEGIPIETFGGHSDAVTTASFSPDGNHILSSSWDGSAQLFEINTIDRIANQILIVNHKDDLNASSFSHDGQYFATGGRDSIVNIWSLSGFLKESIPDPHQDITSLDFSPDDRYLLIGSKDDTARLFDLDMRQTVTKVSHLSDISAVAISPSGQYLLTGSTDKTAILWTIEGDSIRTFGGHEGHVTSVAFSPDEKLILTGSRDRKARLWDMNGKRLRQLEGHSGFISSVCFSPDGQHILTSSWDNTARLWSLNGTPLITYGRQIKPPILDLSIRNYSHSKDRSKSNKLANQLNKFVDVISQEDLITHGLIPTYTELSELKKNSGNENILMRIALNFEDLGEHDSACQIWESLYRNQGEEKNTAVLKKRFDCQVDKESAISDLALTLNDPHAIRYFIEYLHDDDDERYQLLENKLSQIGDGTDTMIVLQDVVDHRLNSDDPFSLYLIGTDLYEQGNIEKAQPYFDALLETKDWENNMYAANYLFYQSDYEKALHFAQRALALKDTTYTRIQLYEVYNSTGTDRLDLLLESNQIDELLYYKSHFSYTPVWESDSLRIANYLRVVQFWDKILEIESSQDYKRKAATDYNSLGWYQLINGEHKGSYEAILKGISIDSTFDYLWTNRPHNLLFNGEISEAKEMYQRLAIETFENDTRFAIFAEAYLDDFSLLQERNLIPKNLQFEIRQIQNTLEEIIDDSKSKKRLKK